MSHGIHINESWHTYGWDTTLAATMFGARTLLLSHRLGRYSIFEWVMSMSHAQISNVVSHISISHGIHLNETRRQTLAAFVDWECIPYMYDSCHAYQWVMPHTSMSHATAKISRNSKISVRTRFEQKKSLGLFPEKEVHIGCVSPRRLHFKRRILLGNLIGPSYLELRV